MNNWRTRARCTTADLGTFFDDVGTPDGLASPATRIRRWRARQVCAACPVATACLRFAQENEAYFGVFGGLDQRERKLLRSPARTPQQLVKIATKLMLDGLTVDQAAERVGADPDTLLDWYERYPASSKAIAAAREYQAWQSVDDGLSPWAVAREHRLSLERADDMCKAMDKDPAYAGPKGVARHGFTERDRVAC